jgi:hypothetical protein
MKKRKIIIITEAQAKLLINKIITEEQKARNWPIMTSRVK